MRKGRDEKMISQQLQEYAERKYRERKQFLSPIKMELDAGLEACTAPEAILMKYLYGTMPLRDAGEYDFSLFLSYVRHGLWLRENMEWCAALPEDIFVHYVLACRVNSEDLTDCRPFFYEKLKDRVAGLSLKEAVLEVNYWCAENATYESTDIRTASPMTMYRSGKGRCGEESTFAVTACRSVGIPARQVYAPRWAHCDDNHAWVEVYLNGEWHFFGACEPEEVLDKGWFTAAAGRALLIHSRTFSDFGAAGQEAALGREGAVFDHNLTGAYTKTAPLRVEVKDACGNPVPGAQVTLEILNMAEYFPAAELLTDARGTVETETGCGDLRIRARANGLCAETVACASECPTVELQLCIGADDPDVLTDEWVSRELRAPKEFCPVRVRETAQQVQTGLRRQEESKRIREKRFARALEAYTAQADEADAALLSMLRTAGENGEEILKFLKRDENPLRRRMLDALSVKDYKDLKADVLEDHLDCSRGDLPEDIFEQYVLSPRIWKEELKPWRSEIRARFTEEEKEAFRQDPEKIWRYVQEHVDYAAEEEYGTIFATPSGCLRMGRGSEIARAILFVAICRSLNLAARVETARLNPQYYRSGVFVTPKGAKASERVDGTQTPAVLTLTARDGEEWKYDQTWTIGKLAEDGYETLHLGSAQFKEGGKLDLSLEPGIYRLLACRRLPNGNQHVAERAFSLNAGEEKQVEMFFWESGLEELLVDFPLEDFLVAEGSGETHSMEELVSGKPTVLAFLGVGEEPTEHVLNEMMEAAKRWNSGGYRMIAVLRKESELQNATLQKALDSVDGVEIFFDCEKRAEMAAREMFVDPEKLPLLVVLKGGLRGIFACAGYNVGSVDLAMKLLQK